MTKVAPMKRMEDNAGAQLSGARRYYGNFRLHWRFMAYSLWFCAWAQTYSLQEAEGIEVLRSELQHWVKRRERRLGNLGIAVNGGMVSQRLRCYVL